MDPLGLINKVQHGADDQIQYIPQLNIYMSSSSAFSSINTDILHYSPLCLHQQHILQPEWHF